MAGPLLGSKVDVRRLSGHGRALRGAFGGRMSGGVSINISTTPPAADLAFNVEAFADMLDDMKPVWGDVRSLFNAHQTRHFDTEGASTGAKWPSNSEPNVPNVPGFGPYDRYKQRAKPGAKVLVFSGKLRTAATGGAGSLTKLNNKAMALGVNQGRVRYAKDHHEGNKVKSALFGREVQLKKRPVIRFNGRPYKGGQNGLGSGPRTFGRGVQQIMQAHIVAARKRALNLPTHASRATIDRILSEPTR